MLQTKPIFTLAREGEAEIKYSNIESITLHCTKLRFKIFTSLQISNHYFIFPRPRTLNEKSYNGSESEWNFFYHPSSFETKILHHLGLWIKSSMTCQALNRNFLQRVWFWFNNFTTRQFVNILLHFIVFSPIYQKRIHVGKEFRCDWCWDERLNILGQNSYFPSVTTVIWKFRTGSSIQACYSKDLDKYWYLLMFC